MKVIARLNNYRRSAQKVRESGKLIVGSTVGEAIVQLDHLMRGDAEQLKVLLESAVANAENNYKLDKDNLFISNITVNEGRTLKRWRPRAYGRAAQILKRTCHVILELDEIEEGKKVKTKKAKKVDSREEKKDISDEQGDEKGKDAIKADEKDPEGEQAPYGASKKGKSQIKGGGGKKVFRRKSF